MYRRLCLDDEITDQHRNRKQNPVKTLAADQFADVVAHRHEPDIDAGQKEHQSHIGKDQTDADTDQRFLRHFDVKCIEQEKERHDRC